MTSVPMTIIFPLSFATSPKTLVFGYFFDYLSQFWSRWYRDVTFRGYRLFLTKLNGSVYAGTSSFERPDRVALTYILIS
jgi:hypothetical protein